MTQPPFFHVDHARRDIEALTISVRGPVQDNDEASAAQQHLSAAIYPWTNRETGKSKVTMPRAQNAAYELDIVGGTYFPFVLKEWHNWGFLKLNVKCLVTTSDLPFIQPDYSHGHSHSHHQSTRPLMWIGIGTETTPPATTATTMMTAAAATKLNSLGLVQLAYRVGGMHQGSKPAYWVHKDDGGVEMI
ncbi:hypothetical protein AYO20_09248 [Fonsecaea nubica]|uniref:Uncharacterized protein n=1 Tax=Fonsecaea nubica TaxID=856822 RepID=A0A178CJF5_9EURO|nr:hypothetical protein AYO20_09248 [Fonsecaea nubica]OAL29195.1 hypothetical protein AYO20_09248 [Fonsecaea nubica]